MSRIRLLPDEELGASTLAQVKAAENAGADASVLKGLAQNQSFF